jgi:probable HAF family extracellular repeat protein
MLYGGTPVYGQCAYDISIVAGPDCGGLASPTRGSAINEAGEVAGYYTLCGIGNGEAFYWDGGPDLITLERPPGAVEAAAWGINDEGVIAGTMNIAGIGDRAFVHDGTEFIDLGVPPGAEVSVGAGINNRGDVVGKWGLGIQAFLYRDGVMTDLTADLGTSQSEAMAINDSGQVVGGMGTSLIQDGHAFIWNDGNVTDLGVIPKGFTAKAAAINNLGHVVGSGRISTTTEAFLWDGRTMINLGTLPGFERGAAFDINDVGQIVGRAWRVGGNSNIESSFIWQNGVMTDLNDLLPPNTGVEIAWATAINNQGQITGLAEAGDGSGDVFAVLLTPIEPPVGDLDADCTVGIIDFLTLLALWGPCPAPCPPSCTADLDGDCTVGIVDFLLLLANWG